MAGAQEKAGKPEDVASSKPADEVKPFTPTPVKDEPKAEEKDPMDRLVQVVVAPRRTVVVASDGIRPKRFGPGEVLELPMREAINLRSGGFLTHNSTPIPEPLPQRISAEDRLPTVNGADGSVIRTVTKP